MRGFDRLECGHGGAHGCAGQGSGADDAMIMDDHGAIFCDEGVLVRKHLLQGGELAARGGYKGHAELVGTGADRGEIWWKLPVAVQ